MVELGTYFHLILFITTLIVSQNKIILLHYFGKNKNAVHLLLFFHSYIFKYMKAVSFLGGFMLLY